MKLLVAVIGSIYLLIGIWGANAKSFYGNDNNELKIRKVKTQSIQIIVEK